MDLILMCFALGLTALVLLFLRPPKSKKQLPLAPGPFNWPIVGCLFSLREPLHAHLARLSWRLKSPVLYLRIGMVPYCVVTSAATAEEVLKTRDAQFAHRMETSFWRALTFGYNDIVFTPMGPRRTKLKSVATQHLFTTSSLNATSQFREQEAARLVRSIYSSSASGGAAPLDMRVLLGEYTSRALCMLLFGEELVQGADDLSAALNRVVDQIIECVLALNVGDLFPLLERFDLQGITRKFVREVQPELVRHLRAAIRHHRQQQEQQQRGASQPPDFLHLLLQLGDDDQLEDAQIMGLLMDMVLGGLETSRVTAEWTLVELINNPETMERAQREIDELTQRARLVKESELGMLPYMQAIVKESLRLHPPVPMGLPHCNPEESSVAGYRVPAKSTVLVSLWAIGRDPACWPEPLKFMPDRFLDSAVSVTGQNFQVLPFGSGRRLCPGYQLALRSVTLVLATLLQSFDWKAPGGRIDTTEVAGKITCSMASLHVIASPRLDVSLLQQLA